MKFLFIYRELDTTLTVTPCSQSHNKKSTFTKSSDSLLKYNNNDSDINKSNSFQPTNVMRKISSKKLHPSTQTFFTRNNLGNKKLTKTFSLSSDTISQQQQQNVKYTNNNNDIYPNQCTTNNNHLIRNSCKLYRNQIANELDDEKNYSLKNTTNIIDRRNSIDNGTIRSAMFNRKPAATNDAAGKELHSNDNNSKQQICNRFNDRNNNKTIQSKYKIIKTLQNNQIKENAPKNKFQFITKSTNQSTINNNSNDSIMLKKNNSPDTNTDYLDTKLKAIDDRIRKHKLQMKMATNSNDKIKISNYYVDLNKNKKQFSMQSANLNHYNNNNVQGQPFLKTKLCRTKSQTDSFNDNNNNDFGNNSNQYRVKQTNSNYGIISATDLFKLRAP